MRRAHWALLEFLMPKRAVQCRGLHFTLRCNSWLTEYRFLTYNEKEPETLDWIDQWLKPGETVFDIGANIGVYTIYMALRYPQTRVIAFEPEYANLHLLRDNIIDNRLQERVEAYAVALSDRTGVSHLHLQDVTPGAALHTESRVLLERTLGGAPVVLREGIWAVTLDEFCKETGLQPNAMKIDVDGTEPSILKGATHLLHAQFLRSLLIEMPVEPEARATSEQLLRAAGMKRVWHDPHHTSPNEVWVRNA